MHKMRIRSAHLKSWLLGIFLVGVVLPVGAVPLPTEASAERANAGAYAVPAAAWHYLCLAKEAARRGDSEAAIGNYRIAANLDPDLLSAWIGLTSMGLPADLQVIIEGLTGAGAAIRHNWGLQRRLAAALIPSLWMATILAAIAFLAGIGLRHLRRIRHVLHEAFRPHFGRGKAGGLASLLCLAPVVVQWGLAAAAATYMGLARGESTRREKRVGVAVLLWLVLAPVVWQIISPAVVPVGSHDLAHLVERAQREVPTPELEQILAESADGTNDPEVTFAQAIFERRSGRFEEAATLFEQATEAGAPFDAHATVNLGNLYLWTGDAPRAAQRYEQVLDDPDARLEGRYNLAIALSRLHRFAEADQQLEEATRLDFARVRSAVRDGDPDAMTDVMDGMLDARELWKLDRARKSYTAALPPFLGWFLPGGSLQATPLVVLFALAVGVSLGSILRRRLRVHECQHCGAPVCRRCVTRTSGHAYCSRCASMLGSLSRSDYNRVLLNRLLGRGEEAGEQLRSWGTTLLPGLGPILRGRPVTGLVLSLLFAMGCLLVTRAAWAFPTSPIVGGFETVLQILGACCALLSWAASIAVAAKVRPRRGVRHYFEKDVFRLAA